MSYRGAAVAALAMGIFVAACGSDTALGPADGAACTVGSLSAGSTRSGNLTASDCVTWQDNEYLLSTSESWTIHAAKDRVYIVRMTPIAKGDDANTLDADLYLYGRNDAGDPVMVGGYFSTYGSANVSGGYAQELIFPSREAGTYSVRVVLDDEDDYGNYEIELFSCPLVNVAMGATSAATELGDECTSASTGGLEFAPVAFYSFNGAANTAYRMTATRTAGTSQLGLWIRGPGSDFACYLADCVGSSASVGVGPIVYDVGTTLADDYTVMVYQATAGTLSASLGVSLTPTPLMASTSLKR